MGAAGVSIVAHKRFTPPYRIRTPRLMLRCWETSDAPALIAAITTSLDHLRMWMPWAMQEPESLEAKARRIESFRSEFESGESFLYGVFDPGDREVLGAVGAHGRIGAGAREIGYWMRVDQTGRGYATEAAGALTRIGFEREGLRRFEIHCDPQNLASAAVPRKLGFQHAVTISGCVKDQHTGPRDTAIWALTSAMYPASAAATAGFEAADCDRQS